MTRAKRDGLYILLFGVLCFLVLSACLIGRPPGPLQDFRVIYNPTRCMIKGGDPYNQAAVVAVSRSISNEGTEVSSPRVEEIETRSIYPPTTFAIVLPFALLPWQVAAWAWLLLTAGSLVLAAFLVWALSAEYAPVLSAVLIAFLLACGEMVVKLGNPAGIAIALCVVAVWCFVRKRLIAVGLVALAIGLALKPHDVACVWLFFFIASRRHRRWAVQSLLVLVAISLPILIWVYRLSPHWLRELGSNIAMLSAPGGPVDLSPAPIGSRGGGIYINLQAAIAFFQNDPWICNLITYAVCLILLVVWVVVTLRRSASETDTWLGLAAGAPLSMLPVYHHLLDAKILLLAIPGCAMLLAKRHPYRWTAFALVAAGIFVTADLPWGVFLALTHSSQSPVASPGRLLLAAEILPAPLTLLVMSVVLLWLHNRYMDEPESG